MDDNPKTCVICGGWFSGWGNNPDPVYDFGRACNPCNETVVIPARLRAGWGSGRSAD